MVAASADRPAHVLVGTLGRAVGLRGEIELVVHSDDPERFAPGARVLAAPELRPLTVRAARSHHGRTVASFDEIPDRPAAEALRGVDLVVPSHDVRQLPDGEFWDFDLVGCRVVAGEAGDVGMVAEVLHLPANDVLVVRREDAEEILVPLISQVVTNVDLEAREITIDPIPGLLHDDDQ